MLKQDPFAGHMFVFRGRRGDLIKIIWWDGQGAWLHDQLPTISGKSPLAVAIRYGLTRMKRLRPYLNHRFLELDTDVVEQPLSQLFCSFGGLSFHASTMAA